MKRPLAVTGFTMLFTVLVMNKQSIRVISAVLITAFIAFVVFMLIKPVRRDKSLPTAALSVIFVLIILVCNDTYYMHYAKPLSDKTLTVSGHLTDLPYQSNGKNYYIIKADQIDGQRSDMKIRLVSSSPIDLEPSDRVTANIKLFLLGENNDESLKYYKSKALLLGGYSIDNNIKIEKREKLGITDRILMLRQQLSKEIMSELPNSYGGIIAGICFGVKTFIPEIVSTSFSAAGVSHLLAVSGLHLSVWSTMLYAILRKLRVKQRMSSIAAILFIAFFAVLTGLNPPVIRAGIMLSIMFAAGLFKREADSLNSIGLALTVMLFVNPYMAVALGFQLSVFATTGLIVFMKPVSEFLNRPISNVKNKYFTKAYKFISAAIAVSVSVTIATLPIYLVTLPSIPTMLIISNLLMVTVGSICMTTGGLATAFLALGLDVIGKPLILVSGLASKYLINLSSHFADFHFSLIPINSNWSRIILAAALILLAVVLILNIKNKRTVKYIALTLAAAFLIANISIFALSNLKVKLTVANVGDGTAVVLKYKGKTAVIGCGGDYYAGAAVCDIISKYGSTTVDCLILPSKNNKSTSGVSKISRTYKIATVYLSDETLNDQFQLTKTEIFQNSDINIFDNKLKIIPFGENNTAVKIIFGEFTAIISFENTDNLNGEKANILICRKAIPQGTDYDDFDLTVISTDKETADNPFDRGQILLTSQNGDISFLIDNNSKMQYWRAN